MSTHSPANGGGRTPDEPAASESLSPSTSPVSARHADLADAPRIAELLTVLGYPSSPSEVVKRLQGIAERPDFASWVAEAGGHVVGFAGACTAPAFEKNGTYGRILALVVDPDARGLGVGRLLVRVAERWMRDGGAAESFVHSGSHRTEAHGFYRRVGYEATGVRFRKRL